MEGACGGDFWDYDIDLVLPFNEDSRSICRDCGGEYHWFIKKDDRNMETFRASLLTTSNGTPITHCTEIGGIAYERAWPRFLIELQLLLQREKSGMVRQRDRKSVV